uniref:Cysteine proteinase inhibitor n=1 Tax=Rhizophora mucronata TaxID=61149 RepID=A0A2P2J914_RHIMU
MKGKIEFRIQPNDDKGLKFSREPNGKEKKGKETSLPLSCCVRRRQNEQDCRSQYCLRFPRRPELHPTLPFSLLFSFDYSLMGSQIGTDKMGCL